MSTLKRFRWPIAVFCLFGLVAGTMLTVNAQWVRIQHIDIEIAEGSNQNLLFERIQKSLQQALSNYEGKYFWQVPIKSVFDIAIRDKRVRSAAVFREFPSRIKIKIEPHTPVLAYLGADGRIYPVAMDATLLPAIPFADATDLPLLRGDELKDEHALREQALELYDKIPLEGPLRKSTVSEIVHAKKDGFKIFVSGTQAELRLGDTDFGPKISRVQKVLTYLDSRNIKGRVIDARFSKKVLVRVRNTP